MPIIFWPNFRNNCHFKNKLSMPTSTRDITMRFSIHVKIFIAQKMLQWWINVADSSIFDPMRKTNSLTTGMSASAKKKFFSSFLDVKKGITKTIFASSIKLMLLTFAEEVVVREPHGRIAVWIIFRQITTVVHVHHPITVDASATVIASTWVPALSSYIML